MHFYMFNPADFNNSARHLTLPERAIYRDLIDMYYHSEQAIDTTDMDVLARRLLCTTPEYRSSLDYILGEFFIKRGKRHHHHRIDKEIKDYQYKNSKRSATANANATLDEPQKQTLCNANANDYSAVDDIPLSSTERGRQHRQDKKAMIASLVAVGVAVNTRTKIALLRELYAEHINAINSDATHNSNDNSSPCATNDNATCNAANAKNAAITSNYKPVTSNQVKTLNNNAAVAEKFDVEFWQPTLTVIQSIVTSEAPAMPVMTQSAFDSHLAKFKNFRIEQKVKGDPVATEARCVDMFVDWIKREYVYQQKAKATAATGERAYSADYSSIGKAPVAGDSDIPDVYHPSHSKPVTQAKPNPETSVMVNGLFKPPFPNMSRDQSYEYISCHRMPGEMADEAYDRLLADMQETV